MHLRLPFIPLASLDPPFALPPTHFSLPPFSPPSGLIALLPSQAVAAVVAAAGLFVFAYVLVENAKYPTRPGINHTHTHVLVENAKY